MSEVPVYGVDIIPEFRSTLLCGLRQHQTERRHLVAAENRASTLADP